MPNLLIALNVNICGPTSGSVILDITLIIIKVQLKSPRKSTKANDLS